MRIAVCDDNAAQRHSLVHLLQRSLAKRSVVLYSEQYADGAELVCDVEAGECFDVIFLEVGCLPFGGLETARRLRALHYTGDIVFSSASADFAVDGYEVGACGYLLKPYRAERLLGLVDRLSRRELSSCLTVCHHHTVVRIPYHDILYIESRNSKCIIHRKTGTDQIVYRHLQTLENELDDTRFLRCHQSYLVNMDHIVKADSVFELTNGDIVCIRQRDLKRIRQHYLRYVQENEGEKAQILKR